MWKRSVWSVVRRKGKSALLLLLLTVIGLLVISGLTVAQSSKQAIADARRQLGSEVTYRFDVQRAMAVEAEGGKLPEKTYVTAEAAERLAAYEHVIGLNYSVNTFSAGPAIEHLESEVKKDPNRPQPRKMLGEGSLEPEFLAEGVLHLALVSDFAKGTSKLVEGRSLTDKDAEVAVVVIERRLAEKNGLQVGSAFVLSSLDQSESVEVTVAGIYETAHTPPANMAFSMPLMNPYNRIYMPYKLANRLQDEMFAREPDAMDAATVLLDDPKHIEAFQAWAKSNGIGDGEFFVLDANDGTYRKMTGSLRSMVALSNVTVWVSAAAGALILAMLLLLSLRERRQEVGLLLALGARKSAIAGQLLTEVLLVACVAFALAGLSGEAAAARMADSLLGGQAAEGAEREPSDPAAPQRVVIGLDGGGASDSAKPIERIDVRITPKAWASMAGIGLAVILAAVVLPVARLMRQHPRAILVRQE